jgi:hypothetical protein
VPSYPKTLRGCPPHHVRPVARNQVGRLAERFICGTCALAVDAPGVRSQVDLLPFGPGFLGSIVSFPFVRLFLVIAQLKHGGGSIHGQFDVKDGELSALHFLLHFFHGQDEVRHARDIFVEEEHVGAQCYNVEDVETCRVLRPCGRKWCHPLMYTSSTAARMSFLQPSSAVFQIP